MASGVNGGSSTMRAGRCSGGSEVIGGAGMRGGGRLAHDDAARGEVLGVVGDGAHVLVARGEIDAHEAVGVGDRARLAQLVPDREGVVDPARIEMIEIGGPVLDRRTLRSWLPPHFSMISTANSGQFDLAR